MKLKYSSITMLIVVFIVIASEYFFFLGSEINELILLILLMFGMGICFFKSKREISIIQSKMKFCNKYIIISCIVFTIILFYTVIAFPKQGLLYTLKGFGYYYYVLIAILLLVYMIKKNSDRDIYLFLEVCAIIWYVLVIAQKYLYESNGTIIINSYFDYFCGGFVPLRNNMIRVSLRWFGNLMLIYNFYKFYVDNNKHRLLYLGVFILGIYDVFVIQQTRLYTLCDLVCIFFIVLFKRNNKFEIFRKPILIIITIVFAFETGIISTFFDSFSSTGTYSNSTLARNYAMIYYWEYFLSHPIFGMGFTSSTYYPTIVRGVAGTASMDDVGIIGQFARLGLFVIPIYIVLFIRFFKILRLMKKNNQYDNEFIWYCAFFLQLVITSLSLSMLDKQRIMLYPLSIALFEFQYFRLKVNVK